MLKWSQLGTFPSIYWFIIQESQKPFYPELFYSETVERLSPSCIGVFIYSTSSVVSVLMQYNATCVSIGSVKLYVRIYIYTHDHHHTTISYNKTLYLLYKPYVWICIIIYTYILGFNSSWLIRFLSFLHLSRRIDIAFVQHSASSERTKLLHKIHDWLPHRTCCAATSYGRTH